MREEPQGGDVARIDVGLEAVERQAGEDVRNGRAERLAAEALPPVVGMQDEADLAKAPAAGLADRAAAVLDNEVVRLGKVQGDHAGRPWPGLLDVGVGQAVPVAHRPGVGEDPVDVEQGRPSWRAVGPVGQW